MINHSDHVEKVHNGRKFLLECVSKGRYWSSRYASGRYSWPELRDAPSNFEEVQAESDADNSEETGDEPEAEDAEQDDDAPPRPLFDLKDKHDYARLVDWRRATRLRATGANERPGARKWTEAENQFLYEQSRRLLQKMLADDHDSTSESFYP